MYSSVVSGFIRSLALLYKLISKGRRGDGGGERGDKKDCRLLKFYPACKALIMFYI